MNYTILAGLLLALIVTVVALVHQHGCAVDWSRCFIALSTIGGITLKHIRKRGVISTMLVLLAGFTGCGTDERVVQITQEADRRQEEANREIARVVNEETVFRGSGKAATRPAG